jgi:hypothetical protein
LHDNPKLQLLSCRHQSFPWNSPPLHIPCAQQLPKYKSSSTSDPTTPRYAMPSSPAPKLTSPSACPTCQARVDHFRRNTWPSRRNRRVSALYALQLAGSLRRAAPAREEVDAY